VENLSVFATFFSGLYTGMLVLLFGLFLRPVGFDYRSKLANPRWCSAWDWALFAGGRA
jgi:cytochrome d ubiquinol oxidase subunit II